LCAQFLRSSYHCFHAAERSRTGARVFLVYPVPAKLLPLLPCCRAKQNRGTSFSCVPSSCEALTIASMLQSEAEQGHVSL